MGGDELAIDLRYFRSGLVRWNAGTGEVSVKEAEVNLGVDFPRSFQEFLRWHNGGRIGEYRLLGVPPIKRDLDIIRRTLQLRQIRGDSWPHAYMPVCPDGFGNFYVLATDKRDVKGESPVIFVDGISLEVEAVAASNYWSFLSLLVKSMIRTTKPDGKPSDSLEFLPSWPFDPLWLVQYDPPAAHWMASFGLNPS
jgi:cell wall assembly regulator SMI1